MVAAPMAPAIPFSHIPCPLLSQPCTLPPQPARIIAATAATPPDEFGLSEAFRAIDLKMQEDKVRREEEIENGEDEEGWNKVLESLKEAAEVRRRAGIQGAQMLPGLLSHMPRGSVIEPFGSHSRVSAIDGSVVALGPGVVFNEEELKEIDKRRAQFRAGEWDFSDDEDDDKNGAADKKKGNGSKSRAGPLGESEGSDAQSLLNRFPLPSTTIHSRHDARPKTSFPLDTDYLATLTPTQLDAVKASVIKGAAAQVIEAVMKDIDRIVDSRVQEALVERDAKEKENGRRLAEINTIVTRLLRDRDEEKAKAMELEKLLGKETAPRSTWAEKPIAPSTYQPIHPGHGSYIGKSKLDIAASRGLREISNPGRKAPTRHRQVNVNGTPFSACPAVDGRDVAQDRAPMNSFLGYHQNLTTDQGKATESARSDRATCGSDDDLGGVVEETLAQMISRLGISGADKLLGSEGLLPASRTLSIQKNGMPDPSHLTFERKEIVLPVRPESVAGGLPKSWYRETWGKNPHDDAKYSAQLAWPTLPGAMSSTREYDPSHSGLFAHIVNNGGQNGLSSKSRLGHFGLQSFPKISPAPGTLQTEQKISWPEVKEAKKAPTKRFQALDAAYAKKLAEEKEDVLLNPSIVIPVHHHPGNTPPSGFMSILGSTLRAPGTEDQGVKVEEKNGDLKQQQQQQQLPPHTNPVADPFAAYGGYDNYLALWKSSLMDAQGFNVDRPAQAPQAAQDAEASASTQALAPGTEDQGVKVEDKDRDLKQQQQQQQQLPPHTNPIADPYAGYGGYDNYLALWKASLMDAQGFNVDRAAQAPQAPRDAEASAPTEASATATGQPVVPGERIVTLANGKRMPLALLSREEALAEGFMTQEEVQEKEARWKELSRKI